MFTEFAMNEADRMFYFDAIIGLGAVPGALNIADDFLPSLVNPRILSCVAIWFEKA